MRYTKNEQLNLELAVIQKDSFEEMITTLIRETIRDEVQKVIEENEVKYLTVKEAANMVGVSPATINNYRRNGILPFVKLGGSVRIQKSDLKFMMDNRKRKRLYY